MLQKTIDGNYNFDRKVWKNISYEAKDLINKLLLGDPESRITLE
jgi:hypothetical protein